MVLRIGHGGEHCRRRLRWHHDMGLRDLRIELERYQEQRFVQQTRRLRQGQRWLEWLERL
jgi:hypothetical protein